MIDTYGQAAILNPNYTVANGSNPATMGALAVIYATGLGTPTSLTGVTPVTYSAVPCITPANYETAASIGSSVDGVLIQTALLGDQPSSVLRDRGSQQHQGRGTERDHRLHRLGGGCRRGPVSVQRDASRRYRRRHRRSRHRSDRHHVAGAITGGHHVQQHQQPAAWQQSGPESGSHAVGEAAAADGDHSGHSERLNCGRGVGTHHDGERRDDSLHLQSGWFGVARDGRPGVHGSDPDAYVRYRSDDYRRVRHHGHRDRCERCDGQQYLHAHGHRREATRQP